ncbi:MAG: hypothetical protein ASARMPRED_001840 [Alectoria sarmentosa]|nr:MAG: hypothetical protein ASARMPRED_001840 [Alectoria sarmentosa]
MLISIGIGLVRISVCLFVLRLMPATKMFYRKWIWGFLIFCTIMSLGDFLAQCFQCIPLSRVWNQGAKARCFPPADMTKIAQAQGGAAVVTDLLCVLLPMMVFRNLQVDSRDKLAIFFVIGLGLFTAAAAIARTALVDFTSKNPTWDLVPVAIWASLEQNIGIAVASLPALRQLLLTRKNSRASRTSEPLCKHHINTTRPPLHPFAKFSDSDVVRLSDDDFLTEISSCKEFPTPTPKKIDIEGCHNTRASLIRLSMVPPPLWIERKKTSVEKVEMSPVSPMATLVERKPSASSAEQVRLSAVAPPWGHGKESSADRAYTLNNRRLGKVSPLSINRPPFPLVAGRVQPLGKFEETGLRHSRVATPEEMMSLGTSAAIGSSCNIEGKRRKGTPKSSPKLP